MLGFHNNANSDDYWLLQSHYYESPWFPRLVETVMHCHVTPIEIIDKSTFSLRRSWQWSKGRALFLNEELVKITPIHKVKNRQSNLTI